MIKIGRCFFNEDQIAAIQPLIDGRGADVYLVRGAVVSVDVEEDELQELLEAAGLLSPDSAVEVLAFAPMENQELWLAYEDGFLFVAKDKSGQVYAYKERPEKEGCEWIYTGEGAGTKRLHGDFDCLSFEDEEPLNLYALFSSQATGEDDSDV